MLHVLLTGSVESAFRDRLETAKTILWSAQKYIRKDGRHGYVDLCLNAGSEFLIAVESKIAAGFTKHIDEAKELLQLELYDQWLSKEHPFGALVLLTHFTPEPEGFLADTSLVGKSRPLQGCNSKEMHMGSSLQLARAFDEKVESTIFVSKMARIKFNIPTGRFGGQS